MKSSPAPNTTRQKLSQAESVKKYVRTAYGQMAKNPPTGSCCENTQLAGYTPAQLEALPDSAKMIAVGCGNPIALAHLKAGKVVLDLGSGGGIDVLLAAKAVGPEGRAIGVDMTPEMIDKAEENAATMGANNVEFKLGEIEALPIPDESVDVVISNCVINLSPDKERAFKEAYRVLRKGGRLVVSDIMVKHLPESIRANLAAYASCISGAISLDDYLGKIRAAGFKPVTVINQEVYSKELTRGIALNYTSQVCCCDEQSKAQSSCIEVEDFEVMHAEIEALKQ